MRIKPRGLGSFLILGIVLCSPDFLLAQSEIPENPPPSPVVVSRVIATEQSSAKSFVGSLVPLRRSTIGSAVDGRVTQMFVEEGDAVTVDLNKLVNGIPFGQPLVQLKTVSLDIEIEAANVELRIRQQAEKELQESLPTEIAGAQSAVAEIKARLKYSKANNERMQNLFETGGGVSQREVDEAYSTYLSQTQLNIGVETLLKKLTVTRESRLQQAHHKVEAQKAELRRLGELKNDYTIRAPFSGYVTSKNTELGQWVARGETVLEIIQLDPIELVIPVPQTYIQALQESMEKARESNSKLKAQISVDSLPHLLEGEVVQAVPQADLRSRSFPVKIRIKNPKTVTGHLLKSGMLARATMFLGNNERTLMVKKDALVLGGLEKSLYIVSTDPQTKMSVAKLVQVTVGASIGDWIQVIGNIQAGDQVVVEGNERLQPGQSIKVDSELTDKLPTPIHSTSSTTEK
ncbi:MAG: HlyD family secretion protein [Mariniblastus sp.]|jgi:HlyD family secretion protein